MKRKILVILIIVIFLISILSVYLIHKYKQNKVHTTEIELINIADNIVNTDIKENVEDIITKDELEINEDVIGIIEIPKLNVKAPIREGTTQKILKYSVGHFSNSNIWNGNVALASHNRGNYVAHYFDRINELKMGDEIIYKTKFGERRYLVTKNKKIESTDWSVVSATKDNRITLITCVKNQPKLRICVQATEK